MIIAPDIWFSRMDSVELDTKWNEGCAKISPSPMSSR